MRLFFAAFIAIPFFNNASAQQAGTRWQASFSDTRSFVVNNGQFDHLLDEPVLYAIDGGQCMVLFTESGYTIKMFRKIKNSERVRFDHSKPKYLQQQETVKVTFVRPNPNMEVLPLKKEEHTSIYAMRDDTGQEYTVPKAEGYRELLYKEVFPNIDIRFTVHPDNGFKYDVILRPGADLSDLKWTYPSAYRPFLDADGNLHISTTFGDIVDHAPDAVDRTTGSPLSAAFNLNGEEVSFTIPGFDPDHQAVIDPWVSTPAFPNSGGIWDIDTDNLGNVYIYGGDTPMRLQKYDPSGVLQWTYNTPWDSANYWIGTMITEPNTGECFITAGTDPRIQRISTDGSLIWTANGGAFDEYWKFSFNCDHTRLFLGGTRLSLSGSNIDGYGYVFEIDMNNGSQLNDVQIASVSPGPLGLIDNPNEVRAMCASSNGKYYYMTLDTIGVFDENLALGYKDNHGYSFSYQVAGYGVTNQGINAMAATTDHLYTLNGSVIDKRNIVDGSIILSASIPNGQTSSELGYNSVENGGLALDSCGNVYVGSTDGVYRFDENLVQSGFASTPGRVYDVGVNISGEVVACGQGFVASLGLSPCAPPKAECLNCLEITPAGPYCPSDSPDTLMANPSNGVWSGPGIIDPVLGVFDPAVADTGTHVIHFAPEIPLVCGIDSIIIEVNYCVDLQACLDSLGNIAVPNGIPPFVWSHTIDTLDCSGCFPAVPPFIQPCSTPPGCAVPTAMVVEFSNDTTVAPTGNWPIQVVDAEGNMLIINALSELPACDLGCFIVAHLPDTVIACTGDSAQATVQVTGAIGNVSYSWTTVPEQTSATAFGLAPGNYYTVTVTDDSSCVAVDSVFVTEAPCVGPVVCATPFGDMQAEGIGPFTWYEFTDSTDCSGCADFPGFPPCSFPPGCSVTVQGYQQFAMGDMVSPTGNWPVAVVDAAGDTLFINSFQELPLCAQTCYLTVSVPDSVVSCFGENDAEVSATVAGAFGTVQYTWSTSPVQNGASISGLSPGQYMVLVEDDNQCTASDTVVVVENDQITLVVSGTDSLCAGVASGNAQVLASGGSGDFTYSWNTTPVQSTAQATGLSVGTYSVLITDLQGCTAIGTWTIAEQPSVEVSASTGGQICPGSSDGEASAIATNGTPPYTYTWSTTPAQLGQTVSGLPSGSYTVTATDQDGCQGSATVLIEELPPVMADAGMHMVICRGGSATLSASGGVNYQWSDGQAGATVTVSPDQTTTYTVTVTDANNCMATDTVSVAVIPVPEVSIEQVDSVVCDVQPPFVIVGNPPGGTFSGQGVSIDGFFEPLIAGGGTHAITYSYSAVENCQVDTTIFVTVDEHLCDVTAPNIVNPNSDFEGETDFCGNTPQNNVFSLPCLEWYPGNRVLIYDRWGRKCYEQSDYHLNPWDGGGHSTGVYYYIIELPNESPIKGFFQLVR